MRRHPGVLVFALCATTRALALLWFPPDTSVLYYWEASRDLLTIGAPALDGVVDTSIEPLYPALLALLRAITGDSLSSVLIAQVVLASGAGVLLYRLTDDLGGRRAAAVAAALYACDPYLVRQSVSLVEITLCIVLLVALAWTYARGTSTAHASATGFLVALATLTRVSLLPVAAGALGLLLWRRHRKQAAAFAVAFAIPAGAWMLRMHAINGAIVPTRIGVNLFVSTNEYADQVVPLRNVDLLVPWAYATLALDVEEAQLDELQLQRALDNALFARALAFARDRPMTTVELKLRNLAYVVAPVLLPLDRKPRGAVATIEGGHVRVTGLEPRPLRDHVLYSMSRLVLIAGALLGLVLRRGRWHRVDGMLFVIAGSIIAVHTVFFPTSRLLAPMAFVLMIYAGIGVRSCFLHE